MKQSWMRSALNWLHQRLIPRPHLAKTLIEGRNTFEARLRDQPHLDPKIIDAILAERERIRVLFEQQCPEYAGRVVVCVTPPNQAPLAVFVWEERLYVLVSATQIGYPVDHPNEPGLLAWQWLVQHELAHVRRGHLSSMFWVRHIHRWLYLLGSFIFLGWHYLPEYPILNELMWGSGTSWALAWSIQTLFCLGCEWRADRDATAAIQDGAVLVDAEKTLMRWTRFSTDPAGWIRRVSYLLNSILLDPHPPLRLRIWLLRSRRQQLETSDPRCALDSAQTRNG